ncbi:hypothetical protein [Vibrio campbellii]|uniref:hypothetical protein n=1 Tax=Vibrio campbellii TaxID=680 RepID=UPI0005EDFD4C|nr:hypothetical protein [Vibrio campbellii]
MRINHPIDTKPIRDHRPSTQLSFDVKTIRWSTKAKQKVKAILNFIGLRSEKKASSKLNKVSVATNVNYSSINECNSSEIVRVPSERNSKPRQESMKESSGVVQLQRSSASAIAEHLPSKALSKKNTIAHLSPESSGRVENNTMPSPISHSATKTSNLKRQFGFNVEKNVHHKVSPDEPAEVQTNETKCKANASLENSQVSSSQPLIETSVVSKEANIDGLFLSYKEKQKLVERKLKNGPKTPAEALIKQKETRNKKTSPPKTSVPDAPSPTTLQVSLKPGVIPPPPPPPPLGLLSGPNKVWTKNVWAPVDVGETPSGNKKNHVVSAKKYIDEHKTKEMDSIIDELRKVFESKNK